MSTYIPPHLRNRSTPAPAPAPAPSPLSSSTMASFTKSRKPSSVTAPQSHDFPSLSKGESIREKKSVWSQSANKSFAELAHTWGVTQREQEEQERQMAKERMTKAQLKKEEKEKERSYYRVHMIDSTRLIYESQNSEKEYQDTQRHQAEYDVEDEDMTATYENDNEEEDKREMDSDWNHRRHRNELY